MKHFNVLSHTNVQSLPPLCVTGSSWLPKSSFDDPLEIHKPWIQKQVRARRGYKLALLPLIPMKAGIRHGQAHLKDSGCRLRWPSRILQLHG